MKKAISIIKSTLIYMLIAFVVFMMIFTIISVTTFNRNDRALFGYKAYIVNSDSMAYAEDGSKGLFQAGDLIFVKEVDPRTLEVGDVITFVSQETESFGEAITHKIRSKAVDSERQSGFITYGTTTNTDDEVIVTYPYILGKYQAHIPKLGTFFNFMKSTPGYIVCIFVPFVLLIISQSVKFFRLFRRYRSEQMQSLNEERKKIEEEKKQSAEMLKELQELQAKLAAVQQSGVNPQEDPSPVAETAEADAAPVSAGAAETAPSETEEPKKDEQGGTV